MSTSFIPTTDAGLLTWSKANSAKLTSTPTVFFVTPTIASAYAALVEAYEEAFTAAKADNAGKTDRLRKDVARNALVESARSWARLVQGQPGMTIDKRNELGLNLRDNPGTPINPPVAAPVVTVAEAMGRLLRLKVRTPDGVGRRKASGAQGATVFTYVGNSPSANPKDWQCQGQTTRGDFDLELDNSVPAGACVWISAVWYSPRGAYSQMSNPISAYIAGGIAAVHENNNADLTPAATPALKAA